MYYLEQDFPGLKALEKGEYEKCTFTNCQLSSINLQGIRFIDCTFFECDLSMIKLEGVTFQDVYFKDCKMLGIRFDNVNNFGLGLKFENCRLDHSSFIRLKLKNTHFGNCNLTGVDFSDSDLSNSLFDHCNMSEVVFYATILEKADLRSSFNFSIDPEKNKLRKAKFSLSGVSGLLDKYQIYIDETV